MKFSTYDRDNDQSKDVNCADHSHGAWWYKGCFISNLNALYVTPEQNSDRGITWYNWKQYSPLKKSEMKIRPTQF
jgi:hypothetical protein